VQYNDNFWHKDAHMNISSPACLIFFVKSKTENQLIRFVIVEAVSDWLGIQQSVTDQAIDQWQICLSACIKAKGKHFEHAIMCCSTAVNNSL